LPASQERDAPSWHVQRDQDHWGMGVRRYMRRRVRSIGQILVREGVNLLGISSLGHYRAKNGNAGSKVGVAIHTK
jgi:hypothetical protein